MREYRLGPEVAGGWGKDTVADTTHHPPVITKLHYEFTGWLGDDIVESFPVFLVSVGLAAGIRQELLTGVELDTVKVTLDPQLTRFFPDVARSLPAWRWLRPNGEPHLDDFWQQKDGALVVSERALTVLRLFNIEHCEVQEAT